MIDEHETMYDQPDDSTMGIRSRWMTDEELIRETLIQYPSDSLQYELARRFEKYIELSKDDYR